MQLCRMLCTLLLDDCCWHLPCCYYYTRALCGLRVCKNWPAPLSGLMAYKATKPGLVSVLYLSMCYAVSLFRAPFYVSLVFVAMCSVFWLFRLSYQYLPSDWLERLLWGSLIVERGSSPESQGRRVRMIFLVYCFIVLLCICVVSCPYVIYYPTIMARYSLFVLKVPLNPKQTALVGLS